MSTLAASVATWIAGTILAAALFVLYCDLVDRRAKRAAARERRLRAMRPGRPTDRLDDELERLFALPAREPHA